MYRELVALGVELGDQGKLPPVGYYTYKEPILWVVHLWPDHARIEPAELAYARPFTGRTSGVSAHPVADEAAYALGVSKAVGDDEPKAAEKHRAFRALLTKLWQSELVTDEVLRQAGQWLVAALDNGWIEGDSHFEEMQAKDWVSFVPGQGPWANRHLFDHPEVRAFWAAELEALNRPKGGAPAGQCAVCGESEQPLVGKMPKAKLVSTSPLHGLNKDAFVSFLAGSGVSERAHLGLCFACADTAARAFTYLADDEQHHRYLVADPDKRDGLGNQIALFWLRAPAPLLAGDEEFDPNVQLSRLMTESRSPANVAPEATLAQLDGLLKVPWRPADARFRLDDYAFHVAVLSPNKGRIVLREWFALSLGPLRGNLANYFDAVRMVGPWGEPARAPSVATMLDALQSRDPNLTRRLLRTAYTGVPPPAEIRSMAARRLGSLMLGEPALRERQKQKPKKKAWDESWPQALAAALKLSLYYGAEEAGRMSTLELDAGSTTPARLAGRLLALLEEVQQVSTYRKSGRRLETTLVHRCYRGASTAPSQVFGQLLGLATVAHLPEAGGDLNRQVENVMQLLAELGGFPQVLDLDGQAEFALGFYQQRAFLRAQHQQWSQRPETGRPDATENGDE